MTRLGLVVCYTTELHALMITANAMFSCGLILQLKGTIEVTVLHDTLDHPPQKEMIKLFTRWVNGKSP